MKQSAVLFIMLVLVGCAHVALSEIPKTRENYNKALNDSDNEQFLLNIVRIHYGLSPYFMGVDTITTQSTLTVGAGDNSQANSSPLSSGVFWSVNPQLTFSQTPTITYTPLQGKSFVSGFLDAIPSTNISVLLDSGWDVATVLRLTLSQVGSLENSHVTNRQGSFAYNRCTKFDLFTQTIESLYLTNQIDFQLTTSYGTKNSLLVMLNTEDAVNQMQKIFNFKQQHNYIILTRNYIRDNNTPEYVIPIKTRSIFSILGYLSAGIADESSELYHKHGLDKNQDKSHANIQELFKVVVSPKEPTDNVLTKVQYEGQWFYIPNNDIQSKNTLSLIRMIFSMQLGDINRSTLPIVTIPIR